MPERGVKKECVKEGTDGLGVVFQKKKKKTVGNRCWKYKSLSWGGES